MKHHLLLFLFLVCSSCPLLAQDVKFIKLINEKTPARVAHYHIITVRDDRSDTSTIGIIRSGLLTKKNVSLNLQNGVSGSLYEFIRNNYIQDTSTTPIELHISELTATQQSAGGLKSRTDVALTVSFFIHSEKISHYNGSGYIEGVSDPSKFIEELIRKNLQNGLEQFDDWWLKNQNQYYQSKVTTPSIIVKVSIEKAIDDSNFIVYSPNRPLQMSDFAGRPEELSLAAAVTSSGMQVKFDAETKDAQINIHVHITPYFDKSKSWFRNKNRRNINTLLHEQKHFDITAIKSCELQEVINHFTFTTNFANELQQLSKQKQKECDDLQAQYDTATRHGQITSEQQKWDKLIEGELVKVISNFN